MLETQQKELCFIFALAPLIPAFVNEKGVGVIPPKAEKGTNMNAVIIETVVSILANLAVTLIGVLGAYLIAQIQKNEKLNTINNAVGELTSAAEQTVLELQQVCVDDLKAASADGKLTQEEINTLGKKLLKGTLEKMSDSGINVLKAANVDINAIVTGAGEATIAKIKSKSYN